MSDPSRYPGSEYRAAARWVKVVGIVVVVVALLVVVMLLIGGGRHGPGRHSSSATAAMTRLAV
jgi:ABC-type transporter Mla subunit MlaD